MLYISSEMGSQNIIYEIIPRNKYGSHKRQFHSKVNNSNNIVFRFQIFN